MGEQISNSSVNPIIVLLIGIVSFFGFWWFWAWGPFWSFINTFVVMKGGKNRTIGCCVWSILPIFPLIVNIDNWKVSQKLANGESVDEMHHELDFLNKLPLLAPK